MSRMLYRCLLRLHPAGFRHRFAAEMLWIFDEAAGRRAGAFFLDGITSLARQWLFRGRTWVVPAAIAGGLLQVLVVLSLTYLKQEARGAKVLEPSPGWTAVLERSAAIGAMDHDAGTAGVLRNLHLRDAQETGVYAWPDALLVLFAIVLIYSIPSVRRTFPGRSSRNRAARWLGLTATVGRCSTCGPERTRRPSLGKAN